VAADLIVFELGDRRCALDLGVVHEVVPLGPVTPVPTAPPAIVGAVNVHGQVVAVLDLGPLLGLPSAGRPRQGACGLLALVAEATVVLHVSRVCEVVSAGVPEEADPARLARPVASGLGELLLVDLGRVVERLRSTVRLHPIHLRLETRAEDARPRPGRSETDR